MGLGQRIDGEFENVRAVFTFEYWDTEELKYLDLGELILPVYEIADLTKLAVFDEIGKSGKAEGTTTAYGETRVVWLAHVSYSMVDEGNLGKKMHYIVFVDSGYVEIKN